MAVKDFAKRLRFFDGGSHQSGVGYVARPSTPHDAVLPTTAGWVPWTSDKGHLLDPRSPAKGGIGRWPRVLSGAIFAPGASALAFGPRHQDQTPPPTCPSP